MTTNEQKDFLSQKKLCKKIVCQKTAIFGFFLHLNLTEILVSQVFTLRYICADTSDSQAESLSFRKPNK